MSSVKLALRQACASLILLTFASAVSARAEDGFPFGMEMTLDALPQPGSKRVPDLDIGDNGEVVLELWCKGGKGQFSVAGNTVVFVPGGEGGRPWPPAEGQAGDETVAPPTAGPNPTRRGGPLS